MRRPPTPCWPRSTRCRATGKRPWRYFAAGRQRLPKARTLGVQEVGLLCRLQRTQEAEDAAEQLAGSSPDADLCLALAATFLGSNALPPAGRWAEKAQAVGDPPRQTAARLLLGNVALAQGRRAKDKQLLARSRDFYLQVVKAQPENLLAANNLAWLLVFEFGQPEKAREVADGALRRTPLKLLPADVADTFALVYRRTGDWDGRSNWSSRRCRGVPIMRP